MKLYHVALAAVVIVSWACAAEVSEYPEATETADPAELETVEPTPTPLSEVLYTAYIPLYSNQVKRLCYMWDVSDPNLECPVIWLDENTVDHLEKGKSYRIFYEYTLQNGDVWLALDSALTEWVAYSILDDIMGQKFDIVWEN